MSRTDPNVLFLGLNYPPEPTGIAPYTSAMAQGLRRRGSKTRVLTAHPHYPEWTIRAGYGQWTRDERVNGVNVRRMRHYVPRKPKGIRRALSEASFGVRLQSARWSGADAIVAVSPALIASAFAAARARTAHRKTPFIVWVQDLYTLGMAETGFAPSGVVRMMGLIEGWLLRRADKVIVIHDRFVKRVRDDFGIPEDRIEVVRNWTHLPPAPAVDVAATREKFGWKDGEVVVLHAGNMGVKQGLGNVVNAAKLAEAEGKPVRFVLLGDGADRARLEQLGRGVSTLQLLHHLNNADFSAALASADCLLVNELPGVSEMAVPSKLTSYFSAGRPVVAATDLTGITAEEVLAADAGVVVSAGDPASILGAALTVGRDPEMAARLGANGKRYRETVLDEETAIDKFVDILREVTGLDGFTSSAPLPSGDVGTSTI